MSEQLEQTILGAALNSDSSAQLVTGLKSLTVYLSFRLLFRRCFVGLERLLRLLPALLLLRPVPHPRSG